MENILPIIAILAGGIFIIWLIIATRGLILILGVVAFGLIWGFSETDCPRCDGHGKFQEKIKIKEDCQSCRGKGSVVCNYYEIKEWEQTGFGKLLGAAEKAENYCEKGNLYSRLIFNNGKVSSSDYKGVCPRCSGTQKVDCSICNGYGYFERYTTEYEDDSFCNGTGKVKNFKVMLE